MWVWLALVGMLGAAAVSSLQLAVDRASAGLTIAALQDRSSCPRCSAPLLARDVLPILSFALLHGRCRSCRALIPGRHFVGEVAGALAWALTAAHVGVGWWLPVLVVAPVALVLPMLPAMRPAGPAWLLSALLPATGAALLALGVGGALSGDWVLYVTAGLLGATAMLLALAAVRMGDAQLGKDTREQVESPPHAVSAGVAPSNPHAQGPGLTLPIK